MGKMQFCIHICTFEDVIVDDVIIKGDKDGVHFGRGKRFTVRNGVFQTRDDAIALNAHDYSTSNPELGWIEDGVIENCTDLPDSEPTVGYFCRILAGAWVDWREGMEVQQSDTVVSQGRLYRVQNQPDGAVYRSLTRPTHQSGKRELEGINWGVVQEDVTYTAGVRNVVFRDIRLYKPRIGFSVHFDNDKYSRSYYPGAPIPEQKQLLLQNVQVLHDRPKALVLIATPLDALNISHSTFANGEINFCGRSMPDYGTTKINLVGCIFNAKGRWELVKNGVKNKRIVLKTVANIETEDDFVASVSAGEGVVQVYSDLTGLSEKQGDSDAPNSA